MNNMYHFSLCSRKMTSKFILLLMLWVSSKASAMVGYDCSGQHLNTTTLSLLNTGECNLRAATTNSTTVYIQLLQLRDYNYAEVIQCRVKISRTLYYCGMHSHISAVHNGHVEYIMETSREKCRRMHEDGILTLANGVLINELKVNQTMSSGITLAGSLSHEGKCEGIQYSDPYGTWSNVVAQAAITITLKSGIAPVKLHSEQVMLKSGVICPLTRGHCIDEDGAYTYWKPIPSYACSASEYDVLYEGLATKTIDISTKPHSPEVYALSTNDITFALTKTFELNLCGFTLARTEHPKLFIVETRRGEGFIKRKPIAVDNLDIFAYVNSKFVYVEKHVRTQMTALYNNVIQQKCDLEQQVLKNALALATLQPDEFAYTIMKGPGHMAVPAGEVIHIVKCIPVEITLRKTKSCYLELPITVRNASLFLSAKSRIITKYGTERECNSLLPVTYRIEDTWYQFSPQPVEAMAPQLLQPMVQPTWKYQSPGSLAISGIYSEKDVEKLRDHIMFPAERSALLNTVARGISGYRSQDGTVSMYNLLDEDTINRITESAASRMWHGFIVFGSASAGVIGIFITIRIVKLLIDTIIHGYSIHSAYGCSLHLLGALWSSITYLLLHLASRPANKPPASPPTIQIDTEIDIRTPNAASNAAYKAENNAAFNAENNAAYKAENNTAYRATDNAAYNAAITAAPKPTERNTLTSTDFLTYKDLRGRIDRLEQIP